MRKLVSILQPDQLICPRCGCSMFPNVYDVHHVFNGNKSYKRKSENDGMILFVHRICHSKIHSDAYVQECVKKEAERVWLKTYGNREMFIARYGKDYLWDEEESEDNNSR